jgi:hypothetical protein
MTSASASVFVFRANSDNQLRVMAESPDQARREVDILLRHFREPMGAAGEPIAHPDSAAIIAACMANEGHERHDRCPTCGFMSDKFRKSAPVRAM